MTTFASCQEHDLSYPTNGRCPKCSPGTQDRISVGDDGRARLEKGLGLDINPKTNRAYQSQGDFHSVQMHAGGRFRDGNPLPSAFKCAECATVVYGTDWQQIYEGTSAIACGAIRFDVEFHICRECTLKVLRLFPTITGIMAALHGGDIKVRG